MRKKLLILCLGIFLSFLFGQETPDNSWFKFASEAPAHLETYTHLKDTPWLEPNTYVEFFGAASHKREEDEQDTYTAKTYLSFRPYVLDFDSFSIALGVSYIGRVAHVDDVTKERRLDLEGINIFKAGAYGITNDNHMQSVNFSMLASFPEIGFQAVIDVGHGWNHLQEDVDLIIATIFEDTLSGKYENYRYTQRDNVLFFNVNLLKSFEQDYLNFFRINIYGLYRLKTTKRESRAELSSGLDLGLGKDFIVQNYNGKQNLPYEDFLFYFPDPQLSDEFNLSFIGANISARLFTIQTPLMEDKGISVALTGGIQHISGQLLIEDFHGVKWQLGTSVSIFDAITIQCTRLWEDGNDQRNGWQYTISASISGIVRKAMSSM